MNITTTTLHKYGRVLTMCSLEIGSSSTSALYNASAGAHSELQTRGFVCDNQGVTHEEDNKYIKPLQTVVFAAEQ